jgi:hypothetical protein
MFQRGAGPTEYEGCDPEVAFQDEVEDMFAENIFSGSRASILLGKAQKAGLKLAGKFIKKLPGKSKKWKKNAARDMRRRIRRNDHWPDPYWLDCRVWNRVKQKEETKKICILLPSDVLETLWTYGLKPVLLGEGNYDKLTKGHHTWMKQQLNVSELLGFGFHGDGVPCNYDRTESVMLTSINLPGLTGRNGRLRIPLVILPDHCFSDNTFDDIYEVLAWDMRSLLSGVRHEARHDNTPWHKEHDKKRSKMHGQRDFRACLVQARSDWEWLTKCYHFPDHRSNNEFCWMCSCTRSQVEEVDGYVIWNRNCCTYMWNPDS